MACIYIFQKKPGRTNSSRNCWSLQAPRTCKETFTCWVLKCKSNRRGLFVYKTCSQAETLNSRVRLMYAEVFTSLSNENFINGRADTSWTVALRVTSAIPHSSCLQRRPISYMSFQPRTQALIWDRWLTIPVFQNIQTNIARKPVVGFFLPP